MKNKKIIVLLVLLFLLSSCSSVGRFTKISQLNALKMFEDKQNFILVTIRKDCQTCAEYKEILNNVCKEYDIVINYIECTEELLDDDDMNNLINNYLYYLENIPSSYIIVEGKTRDSIEGLIEQEELVNWLKGYGFIK